MMYLKFVSHTDDRVRIFEADDVQYRWRNEDESGVSTESENTVYCFHESPDVEFEVHVEFWLFRDGEPRQIYMDIGRTAYIMNENGKTIDRVN